MAYIMEQSMTFYTHSLEKNSEYFESGVLPTWLDDFYKNEHRNIIQEIVKYENIHSIGLSSSMIIYPNHKDMQQKCQAFLAYLVDSDSQLTNQSINLSRWALESLWGSKFELIKSSDSQNSIYLVNFSLYFFRSSKLKALEDLIQTADELLSRLVSQSLSGRGYDIPKIRRIYDIPINILPKKTPETMNDAIPFDYNLASHYAHINLDKKSAMKRYIDFNPQHFIMSFNDRKNIYCIDDMPKSLALESIIKRDDFLKEILVYRNGHCYLWNMGMLSTLKREERGGDEAIEVQNINILALDQISFYLKTFLDFEIDSETIRQTINAIAEQKNDKNPFLYEIGQDKTDRANIFLTCFFGLKSGIVECFQPDLVSADIENVINFRNAQKFLINIGNLHMLRDDFRMSALLKNYRFQLGLDVITIQQREKGKKWEFFKNGVKCPSNPFQKEDDFSVDDDMMYFLKNKKTN